MNKGSLLLIMAFSILGSLNAAGRTESGAGLRIVTTTGVISDVAAEIAGGGAEIYRLIPPGRDPHSYEPTPRDIAMVENADLVFVNGFDLEEGLLSLIENVRKGGIIEVSAMVIPLSEEDIHGIGDDDAGGHDHEYDPHTWMSPRNVSLWTGVIVDALVNADVAEAEGYKARGEVYREKLDELDRQIRTALTVIPPEERILVTDHDVFGYFARDYGFRIGGTLLSGFSTASEPSPKDIARLIAELKQEGVKAVFIGESSGSGIRKLAETVNAESGGGITVIELLTGALRPKGQPGDTYIGMMEYNVKSIVSGLTRN